MRCIRVMTNYAFRCFEHGSGKVAQISIAHIQGLERNLEYYSNTAVQCARIQSHRPLVLAAKQQESEGGAGPGRKSNRRRRRLRLVHAEALQQGASDPERVLVKDGDVATGGGDSEGPYVATDRLHVVSGDAVGARPAEA